MSSEIHFTDDRFSFKQDETIYEVHTEVGNGFARVVVSEMRTRDEEPMEPSDESV